MERSPRPQAPSYLEAYLFLADAAYRPDQAQQAAADVLEVYDQEAISALLPGLELPDEAEVLLSGPLINCLFSSARDLGIEHTPELDDEDAELLRIYSIGAWPEAQHEASDLDCVDVANPLADLAVVKQLWRYAHDKRHSLPSLERLLSRGQ